MALGLGLGIMGAGTALSGLSGLLSGSSQRKATERQRDYLRSLMTQLQGQATGLSAEERDRALLAQRRAQRQAEQSYRRAQRQAEYNLRAAMESPQYQAAGRYVTEQFTKGIPDVLAAEYAGRLRTAQAARGLEYGGAPTQQEASLLASLAEQGRRQMLPQLRQLALDPMQLRQQAMAAQLQQLGAGQQMGLAELQSTMQALQAAQGVASSQYGNLAAAARFGAQAPFSAVSPMAQMIYPFGSALTKVGMGLFGQSLGARGGGFMSGSPSAADFFAGSSNDYAFLGD